MKWCTVRPLDQVMVLAYAEIIRRVNACDGSVLAETTVLHDPALFNSNAALVYLVV
jgi:hypothetical protein